MDDAPAGTLVQRLCVEALVALCRLAPERVMLLVVQLLLPQLRAVTSSSVVAALTALQYVRRPAPLYSQLRGG